MLMTRQYSQEIMANSEIMLPFIALSSRGIKSNSPLKSVEEPALLMGKIGPKQLSLVVYQVFVYCKQS